MDERTGTVLYALSRHAKACIYVYYCSSGIYLHSTNDVCLSDAGKSVCGLGPWQIGIGWRKGHKQCVQLARAASWKYTAA